MAKPEPTMGEGSCYVCLANMMFARMYSMDIQLNDERYDLTFRPTTARILTEEFDVDWRNIQVDTKDIGSAVELLSKLLACLSTPGRNDAKKAERQARYEHFLIVLDDFKLIRTAMDAVQKCIQDALPRVEDTQAPGE